MKVLRSDNGPNTVWKYVFDTEFPDAIAEAVLYRYNSFEERTVLCISVQSGCAVGCTFCGTGKKFVRNLKYTEITQQVLDILCHQELNIDIYRCKKFQIMFMSMGEPFHNYDNVERAIIHLAAMFPKADLLVSTVLPKVGENEVNFILLSQTINSIGLQFSIHKSTDKERDCVIPFKNKHALKNISAYGVAWKLATGRKPYCNYCVDESTTVEDMERLTELFPPQVFCFTLSVICSKDETMKDAGYRNLDHIRSLERYLIDKGYNTRIFDPQGQDDIGGGCGQLIHFQKLCLTDSTEDV